MVNWQLLISSYWGKSTLWDVRCNLKNKTYRHTVTS